LEPENPFGIVDVDVNLDADAGLNEPSTPNLSIDVGGEEPTP